MRRGITAIGMVVLFLGVPRDAAPANPPARPIEVIGVLSRGSPAAWSGLDKLVSSAGAPASGTIEAVMWQGLAGGLGVPALSGVDMGGPVYAIYADDGQTRGMVVVVRVSDAPALAKSTEGLALEPRGRWATIGPKALVDLVAPWAMWTLVAKAPPAGVVVIAYPSALLSRYQNELAGSRAQIAQSPLGSMAAAFDGMIGFASDADRVEMTLDGNADRGWVDISLVPKAGTQLAKFVAQQLPSDYALAANVPAGLITAAGRITLGPYRDGFLALTKQLYSALSASEAIAAAEALMKASTGEFAIGGDFVPGKPMHFAELFGLTDAKAGSAAVDAMVQALGHAHLVSFAGLDTTYTLGADTTYDGVVLHEVDSSVDTSKLTADQKAGIEMTMPGGKLAMLAGTRDRVALFAVGGDATRAIDMLHGTAPRATFTGALAKLVDASRQRKDSALMVMHMDRFVPGAKPGSCDLVMSVGFASHMLRLHVDVLASMIATFANKP